MIILKGKNPSLSTPKLKGNENQIIQEVNHLP
jgi:hypothetical protein